VLPPVKSIEFSHYATLREPLAEVSQSLWITIYVIQSTAGVMSVSVQITDHEKSLLQRGCLHDEALYLRPLSYEVHIGRQASRLGVIYNVGLQDYMAARQQGTHCNRRWHLRNVIDE
jgi:hypothetical protein